MNLEANWKEFEFADLLAGHYVGHDRNSSVDIYLIKNSQEFFKKNPVAAQAIVAQAEVVQDAIWNKRFSTFHNTFDVGHLVLFVHKNKVAGFMSAMQFSCTKTTHCIYYSDAMLSSEIRGKKLSSLGFAITQLALIPAARDSQQFLTLIISGNLAAFKFFLKPEMYLGLSLENLSPEVGNVISGFIRHEFPAQPIGADGIIRGAWLPQRKPEVPFWSENTAKSIGFPADLKYEAGDSLLRIFLPQEPGGLSLVQEFVNSRLGGKK